MLYVHSQLAPKPVYLHISTKLKKLSTCGHFSGQIHHNMGIQIILKINPYLGPTIPIKSVLIFLNIGSKY